MANERSGYNNLVVEAYSGSSSTRRADTAGDLLRAENITLDTHYPDGLYGPAEFFVPRDPAAAWAFAGNDRLVIRNGQTVVWEGALAGTGYVVGDGATQGRKVIGEGYWSWLFGARGMNKPWADNRVSEEAWPVRANTTGFDKCTFDRINHLRVVPKAVAFSASQAGVYEYFTPTCQLIRRVAATFDLAESSQAWEARFLYLVSGAGSTLANLISSGSSAVNATLGTASSSMRFQFLAAAACTPVSDGTVYGAACAIMVYTETETISACVIANDVASAISSVSSDRTRIGTPGLTLEPFITQGYEMAGKILSRAAGFGDSSFNAWAAYLDHSESGGGTGGAPLLVLEQQPALTDYDYAVRLDDPNLKPPLEIVRDFAGIANWIVVRYRDELSNRDVYVTPDDNANLKDTTSITDWGQREYVLDASLATQTAAINLGRRYLAAHKDPRFYMSGPITVCGYIRAKNGNPVPASEIRAGKRVRVENFLVDEVGTTGAGLTFIVTRTHYTDSDETCQLATGTPDDLAVLLAQMAAKIT